MKKNNQNQGTEGQYSILVIEDDQGVNKLVQKALQKQGYDVEDALTGKEAIEKISKNTYSLILLDYKLPDMSGKELIEELASRKLSIPFIVITGQGDERVAVEMMKLGARDYIVKDSDFLNLLSDKVSRVISELESENKLAKANEALKELEFKNNDNLEKYIPIMDQKIVEYKGNGTINNLIDKYIEEYVEESIKNVRR